MIRLPAAVAQLQSRTAVHRVLMPPYRARVHRSLAVRAAGGSKDPMKVLVVGGVAGGASAAARLRRLTEAAGAQAVCIIPVLSSACGRGHQYLIALLTWSMHCCAETAVAGKLRAVSLLVVRQLCLLFFSSLCGLGQGSLSRRLNPRPLFARSMLTKNMPCAAVALEARSLGFGGWVLVLNHMCFVPAACFFHASWLPQL
jgi:hypothetical protein